MPVVHGSTISTFTRQGFNLVKILCCFLLVDCDAEVIKDTRCGVRFSNKRMCFKLWAFVDLRVG